MFNIKSKYVGPGVYRFLDSQAKAIYIGTSKKIHRRLFNQHFKSNGSFGHLPIECYKSTYKIEIIKTKDYAAALSLEQILIDRYAPKYNKRDKRKDIFNRTYESDIKENWKLYYTFKEFDYNKIRTSKMQNRLAIAITFVFFMILIGYKLKELL